ncbi:hypothetical protein NDU88_002675 [Pleurodeles waltl]|uniref:Uncharacterized protein n=1 Tax=Pleurodeles waltl TaxID=8319 RepID=A0AAV7KWE5_PLEWA|nr:hypothetical protein NDU88_002675 [Pleurodeles waltl]
MPVLSCVRSPFQQYTYRLLQVVWEAASHAMQILKVDLAVFPDQQTAWLAVLAVGTLCSAGTLQLSQCSMLPKTSKVLRGKADGGSPRVCRAW